MADRNLLKQHADLVDRMATTLGHDLQDAAIRGDVSIDDISDAVLRCTNCSNPGHCAGWLATRELAAHPPEYCRNGDMLDRLSR